jgi:drug/metabolite transporter (DMT)-like permease
MIIFPWLEILFVAIGILLIFFGGYLYFRQWSHVNMQTREYHYISEMDRDKRSLQAGCAMAIFVVGLCSLLSAFIKPITTQNTSLFLILGVCGSPLIILAATFRMRKDLEPYTKLKDDVVFLDQKNSKEQ